MKRREKKDYARSITILGKRYKLKRVSFLGKEYGGDCDPPDAPQKCIRIVKGLNDRQELRLLIHEVLHAADWSKDEEWVDGVSSDLSVILHQLGFGKVTKPHDRNRVKLRSPLNRRKYKLSRNRMTKASK